MQLNAERLSSELRTELSVNTQQKEFLNNREGMKTMNCPQCNSVETSELINLETIEKDLQDLLDVLICHECRCLFLTIKIDRI